MEGVGKVQDRQRAALPQSARGCSPTPPPLYLREGQTIADGIDPARVIFIKRALIDPPEREQEQLPELAAERELERKPQRNFDQPIRMPNPGIL